MNNRESDWINLAKEFNNQAKGWYSIKNQFEQLQQGWGKKNVRIVEGNSRRNPMIKIQLNPAMEIEIRFPFLNSITDAIKYDLSLLRSPEIYVKLNPYWFKTTSLTYFSLRLPNEAIEKILATTPNKEDLVNDIINKIAEDYRTDWRISSLGERFAGFKNFWAEILSWRLQINCFKVVKDF